MSDKELLETAECYGKKLLYWRYKFIGLLAEINRRKLYEKKNCSSIFEFAFKFGGLSEEQVRRALNLDKRFEELPKLKELLTSGEVSMNKLLRVAAIATPENEEELVTATKILSNRAIETFVRDEKQNGLDKPQIEVKSVHVRGQTLTLNEEVTKRLAELHEKGIDINELITDALNRREEEIAEEKAEIAESLGPAKSRKMPVKTERLVEKEHGTKCSISTCYKPSEVIHHTQTFAISHKHDPNYLAPLCKEHHEIAHAINLNVRDKRFRY